MKVEIIGHTPEPEQAIAMAVRTCHAPEIPKGKMTEKDVRRLLELVKRLGHHSVFEHASFTFAIEDVSRALTHQLVRHRIASYSQQSQRYVKLRNFEYITPPSISKDDKAKKLYDRIMKDLAKSYEELSAVAPIEDARYILPNAAVSNIIVTMNARALFNFFELRTCLKAQWEIRKLANQMLREAKKVAPLIFEDAGPSCRSKGF
ncbi:MAG: FAD-dependent thymidylate synthase, partial [Candidatus Dadabacteria bacterium]|nr:FAD-dependent thymidylate synthase [Candidatus Dadabacteria bacterium]